jgi:hypothetical protein
MPLYMDGEHENQYFKWHKCAGYMGEQVQNLFRLLCSLKGHVASAGERWLSRVTLESNVRIGTQNNGEMKSG